MIILLTIRVLTIIKNQNNFRCVCPGFQGLQIDFVVRIFL